MFADEGQRKMNIRLREVCGKLINFKPCDIHEYKLHLFQKRYFEEFRRRFEEVGDEKKGKWAFFIFAPTGSGKTLCSYLPPLHEKLCGKNGVEKILGVYPVNELLKDQEDSLKKLIRKHLGENSSFEIKKLFSDEITEFQDEIEKTKGIEELKRYEVIEEIVKQADIVLTNPDIYFLISFGIYSGYLVRREWHFDFFSEFFSNFNYIIFDEFHLYDQKQKGEILLSLIILGDVYEFVKKPFFSVFMSATPLGYEFLEKKLRSAGFEVVKIDFWEEELKEEEGQRKGDKENGELETRVITSSVDLTLIGGDLYRANDRDYIHNVWEGDGCHEELDRGKKILLCSESAGEILRLYHDIKSDVEKYGSEGKIALIYGYEKKGDISSDIVIGTTGSIGQGIDFSGESRRDLLIGTARSSGTFAQILGRVGRGEGEEAKAYMIVPEYVIEELEKAYKVKNATEINRKDFLEKIEEAYQERKVEFGEIYRKEVAPLLWKFIKIYEDYGEGGNKELGRRIIQDIWGGERGSENGKTEIEHIKQEVERTLGEFKKEIKAIEGKNINLKDFPKCVFESEYLKRFYNFRGSSILCGVLRKRDDKVDYAFYDAFWVIRNLEFKFIDKEKFKSEILKSISDKDEREKQRQKLETKIKISSPIFFCREVGRKTTPSKIELKVFKQNVASQISHRKTRRIPRYGNDSSESGKLCLGEIKVRVPENEKISPCITESDINGKFKDKIFLFFKASIGKVGTTRSLPFYVRWFPVYGGNNKEKEIVFLERDAILINEIFKEIKKKKK